MAARGGAPLGVVLEKLDVEAVEAAGGLDIKRALADLRDGGDARKGQEEAEVIGEVGIVAGDGIT
ncbi:hypothetical protein LA304_17635 [Celeribacter sp. ASW11-22]|nr:hypothetical protein [Celeribacter litoreus]